jgi:hypothetical protein
MAPAAEVAATTAALRQLQPAWLLAWRVRSTGSGVASCGLEWCRRRCGSALGDRPHGIHLDRAWVDARVASHAERGKTPLCLLGRRHLMECPKGTAVSHDLTGGEGQRWLGNTSDGKATIDRKLHLAKKRGSHWPGIGPMAALPRQQKIEPPAAWLG